MPAAAAEIPVNPKRAAMIEIIKNKIANLNMCLFLNVVYTRISMYIFENKPKY